MIRFSPQLLIEMVEQLNCFGVPRKPEVLSYLPQALEPSAHWGNHHVFSQRHDNLVLSCLIGRKRLFGAALQITATRDQDST